MLIRQPQIVWFITPTVSLSAQQHTVLKLQIPSVPMQMLAGNRHLPTWGKDMWTPLLEKTRVVITTPQILLDALDHAYVKMENLALIVFDEGMFSTIFEKQSRNKAVLHPFDISNC